MPAVPASVILRISISFEASVSLAKSSFLAYQAVQTHHDTMHFLMVAFSSLAFGTDLAETVSF